MADIRRRPTLPPNYNINQMRLIHELKVAFPSVPDETVRLCLKKVSVCSGSYRVKSTRKNVIRELTF
jgi:hypothetical protein